jgi:ceramide glucosyltransferase
MLMKKIEVGLPLNLSVPVYHFLVTILLISFAFNKWTCIIFVLICWLCQFTGLIRSFMLMHRPSYSNVISKYKRNSKLYEDNGVSILKPLYGVPECLEENLETYFSLQYPKYELLLCIQQKDGQEDLLELIDRLMKKYPHVDATVSIGYKEWGVNPKLCNMGTGYEINKYNLLWVADANIVCSDCAIQDMVEKCVADDAVALVHQIPWMISGPGKSKKDNIITGGSALDRWYFASGHARSYLFVNFWLFTCLNGMSTMIKKSHLETVGGLSHFAQFVAEDSELGVALDNKGYKTQLSSHAAVQNLAETSFWEFIDRRVRWARLRYNMPKIAPGGPWEIVLECHLYAMYCIIALCYHIQTGYQVVWIVLCNSFVWCLMDAMVFALMDRSIGLPDAWQDKPSNNLFFDWGKVTSEAGGLKRFLYNLFRHYFLWVVREITVLIIILKAISNSNQVDWGGKKFSLRGGDRSSNVGRRLSKGEIRSAAHEKGS